MRFARVVAVSLVVLGAGCSSSSSKAELTGTTSTTVRATTETTVESVGETPAEGVRYLALGDSISEGVGGTPTMEAGAWPALVTAKWKSDGCNVKLFNVALSGYTAAQIISDQVPNIADFKPTLITLQVGGNDIATGVTLDAYRTNVATILDAAKGSGARVLVIPENEWFRSPSGKGFGTGLAEKRVQYDQALIDLVQEKGAELVDLRPLFKRQADQNRWGPDGMHPTQAAYQQYADEFANTVGSPCDT